MARGRPSLQSSAMRVLVLTTSYPREPADPAGSFVAATVEAVRERGVEVEVVSPASFRHFGIAYGHGIVGNIRARPWLVFLENVPGLVSSGGLALVLADLAELGFDAEWTVLSAAEVGAPHLRRRVFILAYSDRYRRQGERSRRLLDGERLAPE